ncbi:hypothetical protein HQO24_10270 [Rhodococcus fascians]|nr:hypothetical protein [Rhodococcus fascians]MBY4396935.1 hypothetical protein [Rhodococcus fascians]MBY4407414.1 hypothetical protein [Rhodococcus fascians]MBY4421457.1 hypothetical protein [Rhodococcus fascians]MBY4460790.1 hypothetical protein [Rhodococcus fascians]
MTFISRGEVYDGYPMGADCDLDALIVGVALPNMVVETFCALLCMLGFPDSRETVRALGLHAQFARAASELPAAAGLDGAGSPVPVSGLATAPGTPNETRNK